MSERLPHNNPWAEKLLQASLPDSGEAWLAMEALLDKEMPVGAKKDWRRWLLLTLLLLLLIGVCHCPGRRLTSANPTPTHQNPAPQQNPSPRFSNEEERPDNAIQHPAQNPIHPTASPDTTRKTPMLSNPDNSKPDTAKDTPQATPKDTTRKKDSLQKKQPASPPKDSTAKEREKGFMAGIGLNQLFPIGGQRASGYNPGGIGGALGDYIPVPMIRYYFNRKLYVQLEAQFNAPQYTKDLLISSTPADSLSPGRTTSISIRKLYYLNLPLSIHYSPLENLSLGAGLQFSRLHNAIGSFDTTASNLITRHMTSLKGDSLYQLIRGNEFRFLVDLNYKYKGFVLGLRYNQALSRFLNVQLATGTVTQARNSSLQLYLRYIIWDGRKKKKPSTPSKPSEYHKKGE